MSGWHSIAKNEIRLWTNKFRNRRPLFFKSITIFLVAFNVIFLLISQFLISPMRVNNLYQNLITAFGIIPLIPNISTTQITQLQGIFLNTNIFSSMIVQLIPPIMEIVCFFMFFMAYTFPIQTSLQKLNVSHYELILSSPVKAKDLMFGNFIGRIPIYAIVDFIAIPILCTILSGFVPLSELSFITIAIVMLVLFIIGTFLGTITSAYLSLKLGQSKGGEDKAKAYGFLFGIIIAVPLFVMSSFPYIFTDPNIQYFLKFIPTTWFGDIINYTILSGFMTGLEVLFFVILCITFSIIVIFLGYNYGDRFYNLELGDHVETIKITKNSFFYTLIQRLFGYLSVVQAKEFLRKKENVLKLVYMTVIAFLIPYSMLLFNNQGDLMTLMGNGMPKEMPIIATGFGLAFMIIPMLGSHIMMESKDMVWIYKKSPRGVSGLVYSFLKVNFFMASVMLIPVLIILSIITGYDLITSIIFLFSTLMWVLSALVVSVGVQCWRPAFEEKSPNMGIDIAISMGIFGGIFVIIIFLVGYISTYSLIVFPLAIVLISFAILRFGIHKLKKLE